MRKLFLVLIVFCVTFISTPLVRAQVTIGSDQQPDVNAVLDLRSTTKGLLLPRVALDSTTSASPLSAHTAGITVYNTATSGTGATYVSPGLYYNDGSRWQRLPMGYTNWFYMPSVSFDTSVSATGLTKDLYALYNSQFRTPPVRSAGAPSSIPYIPAATDLYYYITDYDTNVFSNISISASGVMTYSVTASASDNSYINIVFVLK